MESLSLEERVQHQQSLQQLPPYLLLPDFVHKLQRGMLRALQALRLQSAQTGTAELDVFDGTVADIFDGRLLQAFVAQCLQGKLGSKNSSSVLEVAQTFWRRLVGDGADDFLHAIACLSSEQFMSHSQRSQDGERHPAVAPQRFVSLAQELPWLARALGDTLGCSKQPEALVPQNLRKYDLHHYHSCMPLDPTEPDAFWTHGANDDTRKVQVGNQAGRRPKNVRWFCLQSSRELLVIVTDIIWYKYCNCTPQTPLREHGACKAPEGVAAPARNLFPGSLCLAFWSHSFAERKLRFYL